MNEDQDLSPIYIARIQDLAADPDCKDYLAANKYLLEEPWKKPKVGRPSKDTIDQEARKLMDDHSKIVEAFNRIKDKV